MIKHQKILKDERESHMTWTKCGSFRRIRRSEGLLSVTEPVRESAGASARLNVDWEGMG